MKTLKSTLVILVILAMASVAAAQGTYTTKSGYIVATSKADLKEAMQYRVIKDYKAHNTMITKRKIMGLKAGQRVYIEDETWDGPLRSGR